MHLFLLHQNENIIFKNWFYILFFLNYVYDHFQYFVFQMNFPQNVLPPKGHAKLKKDKEILDQATPIYLKSYDDETRSVR